MAASSENLNQTADPPASTGISETRSTRHVCPFCAHLSPKVEVDEAVPCPKCKLTDSSRTRHAMRGRLGPWYVYQHRNPAAPGMQLSTLLSLIRRAKVPRHAVVRGPTTHQMWKFASAVRGISREWGVCYRCAAAIDPSAAKCEHCGRSQETPADTDALDDIVRRSSAARVTRPLVSIELPAPAVDPAPVTATDKPASIVRESDAAVVVEPYIPSFDPVANATHQPPPTIPSSWDVEAQMQRAFGLTNAPTDRGVEAAPSDRLPAQPILNAADLASVFRLQPPSEAPAPPARKRRRRLRLIGSALLMIALGGAALIHFDPYVRVGAVQWWDGSGAFISTLWTDLTQGSIFKTGPRPTGPTTSPSDESRHAPPAQPFPLPSDLPAPADVGPQELLAMPDGKRSVRPSPLKPAPINPSTSAPQRPVSATSQPAAKWEDLLHPGR